MVLVEEADANTLDGVSSTPLFYVIGRNCGLGDPGFISELLKTGPISLT